MTWVEINAHTGKRTIMEHEDVVSVTKARGISDTQAARRDSGKPFELEHYWYRPAKTQDHVADYMQRAQAQRALLTVWNSAGCHVPTSMLV